MPRLTAIASLVLVAAGGPEPCGLVPGIRRQAEPQTAVGAFSEGVARCHQCRKARLRTNEVEALFLSLEELGRGLSWRT
jgi:hypothetical protein